MKGCIPTPGLKRGNLWQPWAHTRRVLNFCVRSTPQREGGIWKDYNYRWKDQTARTEIQENKQTQWKSPLTTCHGGWGPILRDGKVRNMLVINTVLVVWRTWHSFAGFRYNGFWSLHLLLSFNANNNKKLFGWYPEIPRIFRRLWHCRQCICTQYEIRL